MDQAEMHRWGRTAFIIVMAAVLYSFLGDGNTYEIRRAQEDIDDMDKRVRLIELNQVQIISLSKAISNNLDNIQKAQEQSNAGIQAMQVDLAAMKANLEILEIVE